MKTRKPQIGAISTGTLNPDDLLPVFSTEVKWITGSLPRDIGKRMTLFNNGSLPDDDKHTLLLELEDILISLAPPYCYFGMNGLYFGFYPEIDNACDDLPRFEDTADVPKDYRGYFIHISDHGNVTLYRKTSDTRIVEIWAVV